MGKFRTAAGSDERVADWIRTFPELTGRTFALDALRSHPHLQTRLFKSIGLLMGLAHIPDAALARYLLGVVATDQEVHLRRWQERLHVLTGNSATGNQLISVFRNARLNAHYWQSGNKPLYRATDTVRPLPERERRWAKVAVPTDGDTPKWVEKRIVTHIPRDMVTTITVSSTGPDMPPITALLL